MAAPTNLASKLSRAICAYLVAQEISQEQVYPMFTAKTRKFDNGPIVTPIVYPGKPDPAFSGTRRFQVAVSIKGTASHDLSDANAETERVEFDAFVGAVWEALMQTDESDGQTLNATRDAINAAGAAMAVAGDAATEAAKEPWCQATNNTDMTDFSVLQWVDRDMGMGEARDCNWEMVLMFEVSAAEAAGLTT